MTDVEKTKLNPYQMGYQANRHDDSLYSCPFAVGGMAWQEWRNGFWKSFHAWDDGGWDEEGEE